MRSAGYYIFEKQIRPETWGPAGILFFDGSSATIVSSWKNVSSGTEAQVIAAAMRYFNSMDILDDQIRLTRSSFTPGQYYHKVARPVVSSHWQNTNHMLPLRHDAQPEVLTHQTHLRTLIGLLDRILLVVYPSRDTLSTYGYEIRNLLILACTECETQWRTVLQANGYVKKHYSTNDYVRLERVLRLREYEVALTRYPSFEPIRPFGSWHAAGNPTQDLVWYNAYNATKHNRIENMPKASLGNAAMTALCACWAVLVAQYGGPVLGDAQDIREYFDLKAKPKWDLSESYIFHVCDEHFRTWNAVSCPF